MPYFSQRSRDRLLTCDSRLIAVCSDVIRHFDFSVMCGHRTREEQEKAVIDKHSLLHFPYSRHNKYPSLAVDICPWPSLYSDEEKFFELAGMMFYAAAERGIHIEWGGHWETFRDLPHFQVDPRGEMEGG